MKIRTLLATILGLLLISGLSLSQESMSPEPDLQEPLQVEASPEPVQPEPRLQGPYAMETPERPRSLRERSANDELVTKIFKLKYFSVDELERLIVDIFSIDSEKVHADSRSNRIIIQATQKQMNDVEALIEKLDVKDSELEPGQAFGNLIYRVYMFEIPPRDQGMKSFSLILQTPAKTSSAEFLQAAEEGKIQISDFMISDERENEEWKYILIQGKAPSNETVTKMVGLTEYRIIELKWDDDEMFTRNIGAANYSQLSPQMQKHLQKFLGKDIVTVGYWFGSSSIPGQIDAPIGPWMLRLEIDSESDNELKLRVDVETPERSYGFDRRFRRERSEEILSNTVRAKVGRPIIIGYNRQSYGTRKMGAMVIIPETDQFDITEQKTQ